MEFRCEIGDPRRIAGDARVLPAVLRPHRVDGQEHRLVPEGNGSDGQGSGLDITPIEQPLDFDGLVSLRDMAVGLGAFSSIDRTIELEGRNVGDD